MKKQTDAERLAEIANRNGRAVYIDPANPDKASTYYLPDNCAMYSGSIQSVILYEEAETAAKERRRK